MNTIDKQNAQHKQPTIVGIGTSAGGLTALKTFFAHIPEDTGLAFVIVVPLSPDHERHMADLLQPHVRMPVQQVTDAMQWQANQVYVIPPGCNLNTIDTHLRLADREERRRDRAPIDHFLRTLSDIHDGQAIAVILTGAGTDGTLGIREIKQKSGIVIVQDPAEAEFDGMPQSAIATGVVDLVLPLEEIPRHILRLTRINPQVSVPKDGEEVREQDLQLLHKIFAQLKAHTGRDFSRYKRSTFLRRLRRRMQLSQIETLQNYLQLLRNQPAEVHTLSNDFLINVTSFFRDPEVFSHLKEQVIPELFKDKGSGDTLRLWSVGCATGEEAYSLAILLREEAEQQGVLPKIQVFASDLHEHSLQKAREGLYPGNIETEVNPERLERFFVQEDHSFRIRKEVREMVTFIPHDLLSDLPFSKIDLIACRNLLIYLQLDAQRDITDLFHDVLNASGYLLLGTSEPLETAELFHMLDKQPCLYRKRNIQMPEPRLPVFPLSWNRQPGEEKYHIQLKAEVQEQTAALKKNKELLKATIDSSMDMIQVFGAVRDDRGEIIDFRWILNNYAAEKVLGNVVGKNLLSLNPGVVEEGIFGAFKQVVETGLPDQSERHYAHEQFNGWFHQSVVKLGDGVATTITDITERKNAAQEILRLKDEVAQKATDKYLVLFNTIDEGCYQCEVLFDEKNNPEDILYLEENPAAIRIIGQSFAGKTLKEINPAYEPYWYQIWGEVALTGASKRMEQYSEADQKWFEFFICKVGNGESHRVAVIFQDITERKRRQANQQFLVEIAEDFSRLSSANEILCAIGAKVGAYLKISGCLFAEINEGQNQAITKYSWHTPGMPDATGAHPHSDFITDEFRRAARAGETIVIRDTQTDPRTDSDRYAALCIHACVTVPFHREGKWKYLFTVNNAVARDWHEDEIELIREVTSRTFPRLERAYAEEALRVSEEQKAFMLQLSDALRPLSDAAKILETVTHTVMHYFKADRCYYGEVEGDTATVRRDASRQDLPSVADEYPLGSLPVFKKRLLAGQTFVVHNSATTDLMDEELRQRCLQMQILACVDVPLVKNGQPAGVLCITQSTPRQWTDTEVELAKEIAERTWAALEKVKAEEALRKSEEQRLLAVEAFGIGDWQLNLKTKQLYWSGKVRELLGVLQDTTGDFDLVLQRVHPEDRHRVLKTVARAIGSKEGSAHAIDFRVVHPDGQLIWVHSRAKIFTIQGKDGESVELLIGAIMDMTERKQAEQALQQAKHEAERASKVKEEFLSTMSHEIRTPLNAIIGLSNLLLNKEPRPDQQENLRTLRFSSYSLLNLVNDILDFSKLEASKVELEKIDYRLSALINSLHQAHQPAAEEKGNSLQCHIADEVPDVLQGDPHKLSQVLNNLLNNAIKFTAEGTISLEISLEKQAAEEVTLHFAVKDTGVGISKTLYQKIFDKFTQADSSTVRRFGGTGLGLAITKSLLQLMGSTIAVESQEGAGAVFYFSLTQPLGQEENLGLEEAAGATRKEILHIGPLNILLVEDADINRMVVQQHLQQWWGLQADEAVHGKEALAKARQARYDLILMDKRMPEMDGVEAARLIREINAHYARVPIILLTADVDTLVKEDREDTYRLFNRHLTKPFEPRQLMDTISSFVSVRREAIAAQQTVQLRAEKDTTPPELSRPNFAKAEEMFEDTRRERKFYEMAVHELQLFREGFFQAVEQQDAVQADDVIHKAKMLLHMLDLPALYQKTANVIRQIEAGTTPNELAAATSEIQLALDKVIQQVKDHMDILPTNAPGDAAQ